MKRIVYLMPVILAIGCYSFMGCEKDGGKQSSIQSQSSRDFEDPTYKKAIDQAMADSERAYEARAHGAPLPPSMFPFPNPPSEQPIPTYRNFYSINDHYPSYLLCEYQVDEKHYDQSDEPKWFKASLKEIRQSGPKKFPPIGWVAIIIENRAGWTGASTFEQAHKVGAIFKASDVFNPTCDLSQLIAHADMDRHPFKYDTSQPTPGDQQRWLIVEKQATKSK